MKNIKISPSMLSADFTRFGDELKLLTDAGADAIHWDVMDGSFVEAITFGAGLISACRKITNVRFDAHLMIDNPEKQIQNFANAGADLITVHAEATRHLHGVLSMIKNLGCMAGVALNPSTQIEQIEYVIDLIDSVTVMTVNPGKSGQKFIESQVVKIEKAKKLCGDDVEICVDGGMNFDTIKLCANAGATTFVSGSFLFKSQNYKDCIQRIRKNV